MWQSALQQAYTDKSWAVSGRVQLSAEEVAERANRLLTYNVARTKDHNALSVDATKDVMSVLKVGRICWVSLC